MQTDMHYYGTYAMACAAGIMPTAAQVIATSAEYVDDSNVFNATLSDGTYLEAEATAHHPIDKQNINNVDQRKIWVPFHFLPGNEGDTLEEKLICRTDSQLAREVIEHNLTFANSDFGLEIIGITAHVYADTFSHYGFSGISSSVNRVIPETIKLNNIVSQNIENYIKNKFNDFTDKYIKGQIADIVGLGHGSVGTYPDRPFLNWNFEYEDGRSSGTRENKQTFLEACRQLHRVFTEFTKARPEIIVEGLRREFADIEQEVSQVIATEGSMENRIDAWQKAVTDGKIFNNTDKSAIPVYDNTGYEENRENLSTFDREDVRSTSIYSFLNAAKVHRDFVLDELLPKYNLTVIHRL